MFHFLNSTHKTCYTACIPRNSIIFAPEKERIKFLEINKPLNKRGTQKKIKLACL